MWTQSGFRLLGDFRDVARSVDYLVIDLWEGWGHTHTHGMCWLVSGGFNPWGKHANSSWTLRSTHSSLFSSSPQVWITMTPVLAVWTCCLGSEADREERLPSYTPYPPHTHTHTHRVGPIQPQPCWSRSIASPCRWAWRSTASLSSTWSRWVDNRITNSQNVIYLKLKD